MAVFQSIVVCGPYGFPDYLGWFDGKMYDRGKEDTVPNVLF